MARRGVGYTYFTRMLIIAEAIPTIPRDPAH